MKTKHLLGALLSFLCTIIFFSCGNNNEEKIYPLSFEKEYYEQPLLRATDITIRGGNRDYTRENALYSFLNLLYIYLTPILSFHLINKIFIFHLQYYLSTFT